jgi:hypothetical protein
MVEAQLATIARLSAQLDITDIAGGPIVTMHLGGDSGVQRLYVHCYDDGPNPWRRLASQRGRGYGSGVTTLHSGTYRDLHTYLRGVLDMLQSIKESRV